MMKKIYNFIKILNKLGFKIKFYFKKIYIKILVQISTKLLFLGNYTDPDKLVKQYITRGYKTIIIQNFKMEKNGDKIN